DPATGPGENVPDHAVGAAENCALEHGIGGRQHSVQHESTGAESIRSSAGQAAVHLVIAGKIQRRPGAGNQKAGAATSAAGDAEYAARIGNLKRARIIVKWGKDGVRAAAGIKHVRPVDELGDDAGVAVIINGGIAIEYREGTAQTDQQPNSSPVRAVRN